MTKQKFINWNPSPSAIDTVYTANVIIADYAGQGYTLTLRQLYYQFVANHGMENIVENYNMLKRVMTKARMAGLVSWHSLEDKTRSLHKYYFDEDVEELISGIEGMLSFDRWKHQDNYVEVWVEKDALGNVVGRACEPLYVPYLACKGYLSASESWRSGRRFKEMMDEGKHCYLIHLGDHDPSGIDMTRDNSERVHLFSKSMFPGEIEVKRIALNMNQIEEYNPPPDPAKPSDTRHKKYVKEYGRYSWELDALKPRIIEQLIKDELEKLIDKDAFNEVQEQEDEAKKDLQLLSENYSDVVQFLHNNFC